MWVSQEEKEENETIYFITNLCFLYSKITNVSYKINGLKTLNFIEGFIRNREHCQLHLIF